MILRPCREIINDNGVLPPVQSDHCCPHISIRANSRHTNNAFFKRTLYNYNKKNVTKYDNLIRQEKLEDILKIENLDLAATTFSTRLLTLDRQCMPVKQITVRNSDAVWMTEEIRTLINKKKKVFSSAKTTNSLWRWTLFKRIRNEVTNLIRKRKEEYIQSMEDKVNLEASFGTKEWWKLVKQFTMNKGISASEIPPLEKDNVIYENDTEKAKTLNEYFVNQSSLNGNDDPVPQIPVKDISCPPLVITTEMVTVAVRNLDPNKATGPDELHNKLLIKAVDSICEPLAMLFNRSLNESKFPALWKKANITPVFKKGNPHLCTNYRPISLLSCVGKLLERIVQSHVLNYLLSNSLLTTAQSGFLPRDSTVYQLLVIYDDFCMGLDKQSLTQAIFFDISKAFDRVWHPGLLRKLYGIGIRDSLLDWFKDYLNNRTQAVVVKGKTSSYLNLHAGVPQGSVLGPTLFLIYINDIVNNIKSQIKLFADDTSMYLCLDDTTIRTDILNTDLERITRWAREWKVDFNPVKTELMTLTNKKNYETEDLTFENTLLTENFKHKHLGIFLQVDCKWESHIRHTLSKVRTHVACLKSYKYKLTRKTLETMFKSFILPQFDYCDSLWDNCTDSLSDELENFNLECIRTIIGAVRGTSHNKLYNESGLLTLKERRRRHKLTLFYKIINRLTPDYIREYLPPLVSELNPYHRRNPLERHVPLCRLELYKNSFFPATTVAWNRLPDSVKNSTSVTQFKNHLKRDDTVVPSYYFSNNRKASISHCRLRLEISDLKADLFLRHLSNSRACECGFWRENAKHYFYDCPLHEEARRATLYTLPNFNTLNSRSLTHGNINFTIEENRNISNKVEEFIIRSKRFENKNRVTTTNIV